MVVVLAGLALAPVVTVGAAAVTTLSGCTGTAGGAAVVAGANGAAAVGTTGAVAIGPPGWILLGAEPQSLSNESQGNISWTCWKKVIHDDGDSEDGVPLSYIFQHENVKSVEDCGDHYNVLNVWEESFKIHYVKLPNGVIAAHAE